MMTKWISFTTSVSKVVYICMTLFLQHRGKKIWCAQFENGYFSKEFRKVHIDSCHMLLQNLSFYIYNAFDLILCVCVSFYTIFQVINNLTKYIMNLLRISVLNSTSIADVKQKTVEHSAPDTISKKKNCFLTTVLSNSYTFIHPL